MSPVIDVQGLVKRFGAKTVVDGFSMTVEEGQIVGFLGPNGSGKTTTIRMLCGLLTPDAGRGTCLGFDIVAGAASIKRQVGYMTQRFSLYEDLSIRENLDFVGRLYGIADRRRRVTDALDRLGLARRQDQLAGSLSGGWKQRLALAAAILHEPKLLLLDEPTAGVDPKARREFWDEIHRLAAEGITVLVSTHYMDEAERCHELAYIAYGRLLARGTEADIIRQAQLTVWAVQTPDDPASLSALLAPLKQAPGVLSVAAFGSAVHVAGQDSEQVEAAIAPLRDRPGLRWTRTDANLEDVFISLIGKAPDNFAAQGKAPA
jgi:ABC-2 type transport system ATP-binding protein